jgi:eukaryotic-like serine/threonine-protein kinase
MMSSNDRCLQCGVGWTADIPASPCPGCLLVNAQDDLAPNRIGDYDIVSELGRGGTGIVYRAWQRSIGRVVALKVIRAGTLATPEERRRFRGEIEAPATLDHPNIVPIYDVGEHAGCPYYTMPVYSGALDGHMNRYRNPAVVAALIATVARAVHHGHQRGVLHRDLKPANILLDERDQPHVGDFGTAKRLDKPAMTEPGMLIGTPLYMAPEQALGGDQRATTAVDVYSLGVVLYELITGRPPFDGDLPSVMRAVAEAEPARPRQLAPSVPRALEAICLRCLEKDPVARYRSAEELADDLDRFLRGEPVLARDGGMIDRLWRFTRRYRFAVAAIVGMLLLLVVMAATAISVARAQEVELQRDALRTNAYAAHALAGSVAFHLREQIDAVVAVAADPAIAGLPHDRDVLEQRRVNTPFDSLSIFDRTGTVIGHTPAAAPGRLGSDYSWRNYFIGGRGLGEAGVRTGYVSLPFLAEVDGRYKFGVAAPIYQAGVWVGVLMATIGTDSSLGSMRVDGQDAPGPTAALVAPQDRSRNDRSTSGKYVIILHDRLAHGEGISIYSSRLEQLRLHGVERDQLRWSDPVPITDDAHRDPVPGFEGRWLAGFAPVGKTGFIVIVQSRYGAVVAPNARLSRRLVSRVSAVVAAWSLVFCGVLWGYARHQRRHRLAGQVRLASAL